jgi:hypothetical protein
MHYAPAATHEWVRYCPAAQSQGPRGKILAPFAPWVQHLCAGVASCITFLIPANDNSSELSAQCCLAAPLVLILAHCCLLPRYYAPARDRRGGKGDSAQASAPARSPESRVPLLCLLGCCLSVDSAVQMRLSTPFTWLLQMLVKNMSC